MHRHEPHSATETSSTGAPPRRYTQRDYDHLRHTAPDFGPLVAGTSAYDDARHAMTLHMRLPMWRDYANANLERPIKPFTDLAPLLHDRPALVLGDGPSFHENAELLAATPRAHYTLIAADRTLPALHRLGLLPDLVVVLDGGDQVLPYFDGTPSPYLAALVETGWIRGAGADHYVQARTAAEWQARAHDPDALTASHPLLATRECKRVFEAVGASAPRHFEDIAREARFSSTPIPRERLRVALGLNVNPVLGEWFANSAYFFVPQCEAGLEADLIRRTGLPALPTAGNTGSMALFLAVILGAAPVGLLGLDLSPASTPMPGRAAVAALALSPVAERNLVSFAMVTRQLLLHPRLTPWFARAALRNFSGGILHGPFISRGRIDDLATFLGESTDPAPPSATAMEAAVAARVSDFSSVR